MKVHQYSPEELIAIRKKLRLNQIEFWGRFGVGQSAGSRYELGRNEIPDPLMILLNVALRSEKVSADMVRQLREPAPPKKVVRAPSIKWPKGFGVLP